MTTAPDTGFGKPGAQPSQRVLLCSDLDRTILPNGAQPESPAARKILRGLAKRGELTLAYVSGRHLALLQDAIREYEIPLPDFAIGDVGTTIYATSGDNWHPWEAWSDEIAPDWRGLSREDLQSLLSDLEGLSLQEPEKQNTFKLSYYAPPDIEYRKLLTEIGSRLEARGVRASLIWSIDDQAQLGLLDVLPERATKLHAVRFLMERQGFSEERTVFAGDSGNDLPVLTSGLQAVLVANARDEVRQEAEHALQERGLHERLYLARGGFLGMNGNYTAGVLEGLAHFLPETRRWMQEAGGTGSE